MRRPSAALVPLVVLSLLVVGLVAAPSALAGDPCFHDLTRPPVSSDAVTTVKMDDCAFYPTIARIAVGDEVRFVSQARQEHEILGANLAWGHYDKFLGAGDELTVTFDEPGVFAYSCRLHPGMSGAIVVGDGQAAAGGAAGSSGTADAAASTSDSRAGTIGGLALLAVMTAIAAVGILAPRRRSSRTSTTAATEQRPA